MLWFVKTPSGREEGLILNAAAILEGVVCKEKGRLVSTNRYEDTVERAANGRRTHLSLGSSSTASENVRYSSSGGKVVAMM